MAKDEELKVRVSAKMKKRLAEFALARERSVSDVAREAISDYIALREQPPPYTTQAEIDAKALELITGKKKRKKPKPTGKTA